MRTTLYLISSLLLTLGCSCVVTGVDSPADPATPSQLPIEFASASTDKSIIISRGRDRLDNYTILDSKMLIGLNALYTGAKTLAEEPSPLIYANNLLLYHFNSGAGGSDYIWKGAKPSTIAGGTPSESPLFWPIDPNAHLSFFAYAPYDRSLLHIKSAAWDGSQMKIDFSPNPDTIPDLIDLCVARPIINKTRATIVGGSPLDLDFEHTTTRIELFARYIGDVDSTIGVVVKDLSIVDVLGRNTLIYSTEPDANPFFTWDTPRYSDPDYLSTYNLSTVDGTLDEYLLKLKPETPDPDESLSFAQRNNYTNLQSFAGRLYFLPQDLAQTSAKMLVNYYVVKVVSESPLSYNIIGEIDNEVELPDDEWLPGHQYNYYLTVPIGAISPIILEGEDGGVISVKLWENSGNHHPEVEVK